MNVTIVVKSGANAAQWITAASSVATLAAAAYTAVVVADKADEVGKKVEKFTSPIKSLRTRFSKKES